MSDANTTLIVGAGISGLSTAHALHRAGKPVLVLDSAAQVGGALRSTREGGYLAEHGPNSLLVRDQRIVSLLDSLSLSPLQALPEAKKRYIVQHGKPIAMPTSPWGMLRTTLFSFRGKMRFLREPFIPRYRGDNEESFAAFVTRRLGPEMLASAAGPFVSGIYAGDPDQLSVRHAFPRLWNLETKYGSFIRGAIKMKLGADPNPNRVSPAKMISFPDGMQQLPECLAASLPSDRLTLSATLTSIAQKNTHWHAEWRDAQGNQQQGVFSELVIAVPHHKLSHLPLPESLLEKLLPISKIESPPVTSLVLGFKRQDVAHPLDGFGMLIKASERSPLLGVLFSSSMFHGRAPSDSVTLTCMMGGMKNPLFAENSDQTVLAELRKLLGVTGEPTFRHRTSWQQAIPQYGLSYQEVIDAITAAENSYSGLHFIGNYRGGISVGDCLINGLQLGEKISS